MVYELFFIFGYNFTVMKRLWMFFLFILLSGFQLKAQSQRFFYNYIKKSDVVDTARTFTEAMILDVTKYGSRFWSYERYKSDSIRKVEYKDPSQRIDPRWFKGSRYLIIKKYPSYELRHTTALRKFVYNVSDDRKPEWKISDETSVIHGFRVQKATTDFMGRNWTAWFTQEIPIQDGPYKFSGLPGLILKVIDSTETHSFEFIGSKKIADYENIDVTNFYKYVRLINITYEKYRKLYQEDKKTFNIRDDDASSSNRTVVHQYYDAQGNEVTKEQFYRTIEENRKKYLSRNTNIIDLELLN